MRKVFRLMSCILAVILLGCSTVAIASASQGHFIDVPSDYWAYEYIEALAEGGLVQGYGNNIFGPRDNLRIADLATIICNAKGHPGQTKNGYWGYGAVEYCRDTLRCLPDFGEITSANYSVPCNRELAVYMITKALGSNGTTPTHGNLTEDDIPDFDDISYQYAPTILRAYQLGLIEGVDSKGTFLPQGALNRASLCTILYRAGFTTAAEKPDNTVATGLAGEELYEEVKSWGGWQEWTGNWEYGGSKTLTATEPKYGGVVVSINKDGLITIKMPEDNQSAWINDAGTDYVDAYGNVVPLEVVQNGYINADGKFVMSSGWSYEARQLVKKIIALACPESTDEAYQALLDVMGQKIWEVPSHALPSAIRWIDGREFDVTLDEKNHAAYICICPPNDKSYYDDMMADAGVSHRIYNPAHQSYREIPAMYELSRG